MKITKKNITVLLYTPDENGDENGYGSSVWNYGNGVGHDNGGGWGCGYSSGWGREDVKGWSHGKEEGDGDGMGDGCGEWEGVHMEGFVR